MRDRLRNMLVLVAMLIVGTTIKASPATSAATDTFTWLAEFVSVDPAAKTMTVKARVAYQDALAELKQFKPGEPVWVVWSGVSDYGDAVREFRRPAANQTIAETLIVPAELVSPDAADHYVTLRVKVPDAGLSDIGHVKAGDWLRVTSPRQPATASDVVVAVKPYAESTTSNASTS